MEADLRLDAVAHLDVAVLEAGLGGDELGVVDRGLARRVADELGDFLFGQPHLDGVRGGCGDGHGGRDGEGGAGDAVEDGLHDGRALGGMRRGEGCLR